MIRLFGKKGDTYRQKSAPTEIVDVTPHIRVAIWNAGKDSQREHPLHLSFERIAGDGKGRRTMIPETLFELPQAIALLSSALSQSNLPEPLRSALQVLSDKMFRVAQELETPGKTDVKVNGETIFG